MQPNIEQIKSEVKRALAEDVGSGDVSAMLIPEHCQVNAEVIAREPMLLCGIPWFNAVMSEMSPELEMTWFAEEGQYLACPGALCAINGPARALLTAERTALNFLQTLSATATQTHQFLQAIKGFATTILDTRKTIPGLRLAQKYAVACAGGMNHRMGLYDAILIKENHIRACGSIRNAIQQAKKNNQVVFIEVEVDSLAALEEALDAAPDRILLDNFNLDDLQKAVLMNQSKRCELEASGGVSLSTIKDIAKTGVDFISVGCITKSIRAIDLSLLVREII